MASALRYLSTESLQEKPWPVHPRPLEGELLSSWIVRVARANGMKVQTFCRLVFGRNQAIWNRDIDKLAPDEVLATMCSVTGVTVEQAFSTTLRSYEGILYEKHVSNGNARWILPIGVHHRRRTRFGLLYCPLCLKEDVTPYFRKQWRLAFHSVCERHGTLMMDRCPRCGEGVAFYRREMGDRHRLDGGDTTLCHACDCDLRDAPAWDPSGPDGQSLAILRSLITFHDQGWWFSGQQVIPYGHLFFDVLHALASFLALPAGLRLRDEVGRRTRFPANISGDTGPIGLEGRSITERHTLVLMAIWLLLDWPHRFVEVGNAVRLRKSNFACYEPLPWWFQHVVTESFERTFYRPNEGEVAAAVSYLRQRQLPVSGNAVSRVLGRSHTISTHGYAKRLERRFPTSDQEFDLLISLLEERAHSLGPGTTWRLLCERDRAVLLLMKWSGWGVSRVLQSEVTEAEGLLRRMRGKRASTAKASLRTYLDFIRPGLTNGKAKPALFVGQMTDRIGIADLSARFWKLRRRHFHPETSFPS